MDLHSSIDLNNNQLSADAILLLEALKADLGIRKYRHKEIETFLKNSRSKEHIGPKQKQKQGDILKLEVAELRKLSNFLDLKNIQLKLSFYTLITISKERANGKMSLEL